MSLSCSRAAVHAGRPTDYVTSGRRPPTSPQHPTSAIVSLSLVDTTAVPTPDRTRSLNPATSRRRTSPDGYLDWAQTQNNRSVALAIPRAAGGIELALPYRHVLAQAQVSSRPRVPPDAGPDRRRFISAPRPTIEAGATSLPDTIVSEGAVAPGDHQRAVHHWRGFTSRSGRFEDSMETGEMDS